MKIILSDVRMAFADIWTPQEFKAGDAPRYGATFLFPRTHASACKVFLNGEDKAPEVISGALKAVQTAIKAVADEKWKDKSQLVLDSIKGNTNKFCFGDGNLKPQYDGFEGNLYITGRSKVDRKPKIKGLDGRDLSEEQGVIYAGCYVNAVLDIWAQDEPRGNIGKGIRCGLLGVQFLREGEAFSGGARASDDDFADLSDGASAPDITDEGGDAAGGLI